MEDVSIRQATSIAYVPSVTFVSIFQRRVKRDRQRRNGRFLDQLAANRRAWAQPQDDAERLVVELFTGASGVYVLGDNLPASTQRPFLGPSEPF